MKKMIPSKLPLSGLCDFVSSWFLRKQSELQISADFRRLYSRKGAEPAEKNGFQSFHAFSFLRVSAPRRDSAVPSSIPLPTANCQLPTAPHSEFRIPNSAFQKRGSVLLITLSFILLITVISVAFLVRSRSSLQTSQSYSREMIAKEVGEIGINTIAAQFQTEIINARNQSGGGTNGFQMLLPPRIGVTSTNARDSALIRRTMGDTSAFNNAYTAVGFNAVPHDNLASTNSTSIPAKNGWSFSTNRWEAPKLLRTGETFTAPDWVYVDDQGPTKTASKNIVGRFAAMVYDVGGLLDINEAGVPASVPKGDKGSTALADLSTFNTLNGGNLTITDWRTSSGSLTSSDFYGQSDYSTPAKFLESVKLTNAGRIESPTAKLKNGDNRFFSRMELIDAANANLGGLTPPILPYFRTRSEVANRLSVENVYMNAPSTSSSDLVPLSDSALKATSDTTFSIDRIDGSKETFTIKAGQSLLQNRFPLARLRWLADRQADGTPNHPVEIKKYFGLTWDALAKDANGSPNPMFVYTSPDATDTTPATTIKTLSQWAAQVDRSSAAREPDFFEWLKAAIDPNSLGQTGGSTDREFSANLADAKGTLTVPWEYSKDLHIVRIGANIIDQSDPDSIPTGIRTKFTGCDPYPFKTDGTQSDYFDSFGQENLPSVNEVITSAYRTNNSNTSIDGFLQFELWNPNRDAYSGRKPLGYDGKPIAGIRVGKVSGYAAMEAFTYIPSYFQYPATQRVGYKTESGNSAWGSYDDIIYFSKKTVPVSAYHFTNNSSQFIEIPFSESSYNASTGFFDEPFLATANKTHSFGQDITNPKYFCPETIDGVTEGQKQNCLTPVYLGDPPEDAVNAIKICSVDAPVQAFSGVPLAVSYNGTGFTPSALGIYKWNTANGTRSRNKYPAKHAKAGQFIYATNNSSGPMGYNAVSFMSYSGSRHNINTSPMTLQIDVQQSNGQWTPVNRYHNLAFSNYPSNETEGRIRPIISGPPASLMQVKGEPSIDGTGGDPDQEAVGWQRGSLGGSYTAYPGRDKVPSKNLYWTPNNSKPFFSTWNLSNTKGYPMTDPRTERFALSDHVLSTPGMGICPEGKKFDNSINSGARITMPVGTIAAVGQSITSDGWDSQSIATTTPLNWALFDNNVSMSVPAHLAINEWTGSTTANHAYKDYDLVTRPADARWADWPTAHPALPPATLGGTPLPGVLANRPTILDRPFRNVGELGCVFRDIPWKSLDLFSPDSADRRLLDIFSIEDRATVPGKINPNLATLETLKSLLLGTTLNPSDSSTPSSQDITDQTNAANTVAGIFATLNPTSSPIHNSANMTARLATDSSSAPKSGNSILSYKVKTENFIRALSSTTDTRSWQLMLDVVAQSGRLTPPSDKFVDAAGNNLFLVEGQKRFFVYLTLDRITGEIVDKHVEPVYE